MSWMAYLSSHDVDGNEISVSSCGYTYNTNPMVRAAAEAALGIEVERPIAYIDGMKGSAAATYLSAVVDELRAHPETYGPMNPPNGWGNYNGILERLAEMRDDSRRCPSATWEVD